MLRSMYAGVSGLNAHQQMMDVTGNNISNVNTVGFKSSRVTFKEMLSQTIQGASAPQDNRAGTNPQQVGLGVGIGSIDSDMSSGNLQSTGKTSDVAIQGDGFFVLRSGNSESYSRAGNLNFDKNGNLYSSSTGMLVQGWEANENGEFDNFDPQEIGDISLTQQINAVATDEVSYGKNIDASAENELSILNQELSLEDDNGNTDNLNLSLTKLKDTGGDFNTWNFTLAAEDSSTRFYDDGSGTTELGDENKLSGQLKLDTDGNLLSFNTEDAAGNNYDLLNNELHVNPGNTNSGTYTDNTVELSTPTDTDNNIIKDNDGNLFANASNNAYATMDYTANTKTNISVNVFDSQGAKHTVTLPVKKTGNNNWNIDEGDISIDGVSNVGLEGGSHEIVFNEKGNVESGELTTLTFTPDGTEEQQEIELDFSSLTQFAGDMTANFTNVNGYEDGSLESFSFTETGDVVGSYSNGLTQTQAKLALANFQNPAGLTRKEGVFEVSSNSGDPELGAPAQGGFGSLAPATLEMSNASLSQEFTNMITAQRGFQANSKLITTSDEMLQTLVNLKR